MAAVLRSNCWEGLGQRVAGPEVVLNAVGLYSATMLLWCLMLTDRSAHFAQVRVCCFKTTRFDVSRYYGVSITRAGINAMAPCQI